MPETRGGVKYFFQKFRKLPILSQSLNIQNIPLITVFGSCRIYNPLKNLALNNYIKLNNQLLAYCHTTHTIIQQINLIANSTIIPEKLVPFIVGPPDWQKYLEIPAFVDDKLEKTHLFFIEITSWKYALYRQYYLQHNAFVNFDNFRDRFNYSPETINLYQELKNQVKLEKQDSNSVKKGMKLIKNILSHQVVFVTHCDVPIPSSGEHINSRQGLIDVVTKQAQELNVPLLNPTIYIEKFQQKYNKQAMKDTHHYTQEFNNFLSNCIYQDFILFNR